MSDDPPPSAHSNRAEENARVADVVSDLLASQRVVTSDELRWIIDHVAGASFSKQLVKMPADLRSHTDIVFQHEEFADSLTVHLLRRVFVNQQWTTTTTAAEYLQDIRASVLHESARPVIYRRRGGSIIGILSQNIVPPERLGEMALPLMYAVYSCDRDSIVSAYQASSIQAIAIPGDALWLR